jgi:hypothetical protein
MIPTAGWWGNWSLPMPVPEKYSEPWKGTTTIDNTAIIPASKRYTIKFLKDESLDEILNILKDIIGFDYQQYEKKIVVTQP